MAWVGEKAGNGEAKPIDIMLFLANTSKRIFILEGALTVAVSLIAYFLVPTWSHKAKFVSTKFPR